MLVWFKSLFADLSAGTLLVAASMALVIALLVALGEMAARSPDADLLLGHGSDHHPSSDDPAHTPVAATAPVADDGAPARRSTVSIMVPVGAIR